MNIKQIIIKSLHRQLSPEEEKIFKDWLGKSEANKEFFKKLQNLKTANDLKRIANIEITNEWNNLQKKHLHRLKLARSQKRRKFLAAAVLIGILLTSIGYYQTTITTQQLPNDNAIVIFENNKILHQSISNTHTELKNEQGITIAIQEKDQIKFLPTKKAKESIKTVKVPNGKNLTVILEDNSIVKLNAGSFIQFSNNFNSKKTRSVKLEGEAYFEVTKNKEIPFIVQTPKAIIKVLGTSFNVSSYTDLNTTKIALVEGRVAIESTSEKFKNQFLNPNQVAHIEAGTISITNEDLNQYLSWLDGKLSISKQPFSKIILQLERTYNIKIKNNYSELNHKTFTATFDKESIEEIIQSFKLSFPFEYEIKSNTIIINKPKTE
ncbi:FecR family protein [Galbibacter orientalis]|uniref:FecR family protein n=1 Tax=Galbibacter orientalis TaxID=453852 RepID=UPI0030015FED